jgi:hypothetical protein
LVFCAYDKFVAALLAKKKASKAGKVHNTSGLKGVKSTMKWPPFMSTFVLNKMCQIIKNGVMTEKGFKEMH